MSRPLLLDLYCCEGGAAAGYAAAGFDVIGVDIIDRPRYPYPFIRGDALAPPVDLSQFAAIHASPPCQAHSSLRHLSDNEHPDLIAPTRALLEASGLPWIMENVVGAPLIYPIMLCGSSFGLKVRRHRLFESNVMLMSMSCRHKEQGTPIGVYGNGGATKGGDASRGIKAAASESRALMEMPWASHYGAAQAIPPAYTQFLGEQLLAHI
jgi:DNA (cytosine-5)-methyltransferase 1